MIGEMITGGAIGIVAFMSGVVASRISRPPRRAPIERGPICGCKHHKSLHDPKTGKCHGGFTATGKPISHVEHSWRTCTCRQYTGPEPLPEFFAPELGG